MKENPAQETPAGAPDVVAETHCHCRCHDQSSPSGNRALAAALLGLAGIIGMTGGAVCLLWMGGPEIGINPFAHLEGDDLVQVFARIRRVAFLTIGLGVASSLTGLFIWSHRTRKKCAE